MMKKEDQTKDAGPSPVVLGTNGPRAQKIQQVEKLAEGFKESQAIIFSDYSGLSVLEMTDLRKRLSQLAATGGPSPRGEAGRHGRGAELKVVKNTLIKLAAQKSKLSLADLTGPTAVLLSKKADPIESIKTLVSAFKEKGTVKFGVFSSQGRSASGREWDLLATEGVLELAHLPARAVLEGRLVTVLVSPITKFALILKGTQRSLVTVLTEVGRVRGGGFSG